MRIQPGSRLAHLLGSDAASELPVNSRHHQCIDVVASGFVASATAPDGIVEGIERPDAKFCIGVQWHPENFWQTGEFSQMFKGFVEAAGRKP